MRKLCLSPLAAVLVAAALSHTAFAWGPHPQITQAALDVLPQMDRWRRELGAENLAALTNYCWLPDERGLDLGAFYADDYLLLRSMPHHVEHVMPGVHQAFIPYFHRAIQSLETETPVNACRQIGALIHFVEDVGALPHAKANCPHHSELENWVKAEAIVIRGYAPRLLGTTEAEATAGLMQRIDDLVTFSAQRAERALPLVSQPRPDRSKVEPILLESALESSRVTADVLYTLFTLGLSPQAEGARLSGKVTAAGIPFRNDHGARIVLLGTDYCTLATTIAGSPAGWQGEYLFRGLPAGTYRVLAYRTGSQVRISAPVSLTAGKAAKVDFSLPAAEPAGNVVENPDATVCVLDGRSPDRWQSHGVAPHIFWTSTAVWVRPNTEYRCGALLKDPKVRVKFSVQSFRGMDYGQSPPVVLELPPGQTAPAELRTTTGEHPWSITVQVETDRPLGEAIHHVWVVPVGAAAKK